MPGLKPITRKKALLLGGGAGVGLIGYREGSKLLKTPPLYEESFAKKLSRNQRSGLEAAERKGFELEAINNGRPTEEALRTMVRGRMAGARIARHRIGRELAQAGGPQTNRWVPGGPIDLARISRDSAVEYQNATEYPRKVPVTAAGTARWGKLNDETINPETGRSRGDELAVRRADMRRQAAQRDAHKYLSAGRRGTRHHPPIPSMNRAVSAWVDEHNAIGDELRDIQTSHVRDQEKLASQINTINERFKPNYKRTALGLAATVGGSAALVGGMRAYASRRRAQARADAAAKRKQQSMAGVRKSLERRKEAVRNPVLRMVRKDSWADEQRYLADKERTDAKRRRGQHMVNVGASMVGTTGLAGVGWGKFQHGSTDNRWFHVGSQNKPRHTIVDIPRGNKRLTITATKKPLMWAGAGAALAGLGVQQRIGANRSSRRLDRTINNKLAAQRAAAIEQYVSRGKMPPPTRRESIDYDQLVARDELPADRRDKKAAREQREKEEQRFTFVPAPKVKPMFARGQ